MGKWRFCKEKKARATVQQLNNVKLAQRPNFLQSPCSLFPLLSVICRLVTSTPFGSLEKCSISGPNPGPTESDSALQQDAQVTSTHFKVLEAPL